MVSEAITRGDLAAANFLVAEKYIDAIRALATAPNQKVVIVPIEAAASPARSAASPSSRLGVRRRSGVSPLPRSAAASVTAASAPP